MFPCLTQELILSKPEVATRPEDLSVDAKLQAEGDGRSR